MKSMLNSALHSIVILIFASLVLAGCNQHPKQVATTTLRILATDCGKATDEKAAQTFLGSNTKMPAPVFICRADLESMLKDSTCDGIFVGHGTDEAGNAGGICWQSMLEQQSPNQYYLLSPRGCYCKPCCSPDSTSQSAN